MSILLATNFDAVESARWLALLRAELPEETLLAQRTPADDAQIDIALVANPLPGALQGLTSLRLIQSLWAGVEKLLADASLPGGVPLARMVDPAMSRTMAETALWAVLSLQRDFFTYAAQQRERRWQQHGLRGADDTEVLLLGAGEMGRAVLERLQLNGYRVGAWRRHDGDALPASLARADIVINLLPLTPATRGLLNHAAFAAMKPGAALVNLARGAHVVEADLLAALAAGHLRHAVLDVFHDEPLPPAHPFWSHPQVTVLPHVAAPTDPRSAAAIVAAQVRDLRAGRPLQHLVDWGRGY